MINTERIFNGRVNRRDFIIGCVLFSVVRFLVALPGLLFFVGKVPLNTWADANQAEFFTALARAFSVYTPEGIFSTVLALLVVLWSLGIYGRRFHDLGMSASFAAFALIDYATGVIFSNINIPATGTILTMPSMTHTIIPQVVSLVAGVITIYLLLKKGQPEANQFGPVPGNKGVKEIMLGQKN